MNTIELRAGATELQLVHAHPMVETRLQFAEIASKVRLVVGVTFNLRDLEAVVLLVRDWDVQF